MSDAGGEVISGVPAGVEDSFSFRATGDYVGGEGKLHDTSQIHPYPRERKWPPPPPPRVFCTEASWMDILYGDYVGGEGKSPDTSQIHPYLWKRPPPPPPPPVSQTEAESAYKFPPDILSKSSCTDIITSIPQKDIESSFQLSTCPQGSCVITSIRKDNPSSFQMKYVQPDFLLESLKSESASRQKRLLCLYIGTKYITIAVSVDDQYESATLVRILPRNASKKSIAEVLETLVLHHSIGRILFGNCVQSEHNRRVVGNFVRFLGETGKFRDMKYTRWISPVAYLFCVPVRFNEEIAGETEKTVAFAVLQTYLMLMNKPDKPACTTQT